MKSDLFLAALKRAITIPDYQNRFSQEDLFALINEEQQSTIVPMLLAMRQEYTVVREEITIPADVGELQIPPRAVGRNLRELHLKSSQSNTGGFFNLPRISLEDSHLFQGKVGSSAGFYLRGDFIIMLPTANKIQTVVCFYNQKPSDIVSINLCGNITSIVTNTVTLDLLPENITVGSVCDITQAKPGYNLNVKDITVTNVNGTTLTFGAQTVINAVVGDSLSLATTTCVLQLPDEAQQVLIQAAALRVIQAYGDNAQVDLVKQQLESKKKACQMIFAPRVQGELQKIVNRNGVTLRPRHNLVFDVSI